ncbi:protein sym1-like [Cornus florida]|uniref:protein sym1-like n=1 Tax=Cornus florida TaxID=4283 RepID=UPI00289A434B|nr:protein sym1-like [Cornus florida]
MMGIFIHMRNVTKRSFLLQQLSSSNPTRDSNSIANSPVWLQSPFSAQCTSLHHLSKIRVSKTSPSAFYISSPSYSSSASSSSSYSKMGLLVWYLGKLESRPLLTKSVTAAFIFAAADLTSQTITMSSFGSFDFLRTLRMAGYGMLILGPAQHMWYNFMGRVLPKRDVVTTLKKLVAGQLTYGPTVNAIFFSFNAALQGESGIEVVARLKRDLIPTLVNGLFYWPLCDFLTLKVIPVHLQPLVNSSFSYLWTIYLTYMASLKKPSGD